MKTKLKRDEINQGISRRRGSSGHCLEVIPAPLSPHFNRGNRIIPSRSNAFTLAQKNTVSPALIRDRRPWPSSSPKPLKVA